MKIKSIKAYRRDIPLTNPYTIAFQTTTNAPLAFLEIQLANGLIGYGSSTASEHVFGETIAQSMQNLQSDVVQQWVGRDIRHFQTIILEAKQAFPKHSGTWTAFDIALHDAFGKFLGIPVVDFYGRHKKAMLTSVTIGIKSVEETLEDARMYQKQGFKILKVKTGLNLEQDIERCTKLRETFGNGFKIRIDANQGYDALQTQAFYNATLPLDLELMEQPMPVGTEADMQKLPDVIKNKVACDESLKNAQSALTLAHPPRTCGIFNIKLMKCGGLLGAFEIATIARQAGIDLFWGCFDESIISITAALHAAFACPSTQYIDLDGSLDLAETFVTGGFVLEDGWMRPTDGPGFGFVWKD
jgi:L-alanine-DL-glutamate epimerase-like enolase superfamily enzyme